MITEYYEFAWYKVDYKIEELSISFSAFKITEMPENISESKTEAYPSVSGYIKWDGCMDFQQEDHYCCLDNAYQTYKLMEEIYLFKERHFNNMWEG